MGMGRSMQKSSDDETSAVRPLRTDDEAVVRIHVTPRKLSVAEDGTASHPFSSLHAAVDAVRELKASHNGVLPTPVEVMLEPGTHFLTETTLIDTAAAGEQGTLSLSSRGTRLLVRSSLVASRFQLQAGRRSQIGTSARIATSGARRFHLVLLQTAPCCRCGMGKALSPRHPHIHGIA